MTARELQTALVDDLTTLFQGRSYKAPTDEGMAHVGVYKQWLPKLENESDEDPFPYIIVRLDNGKLENQTSPHKVAVILLVGIYDDDLENNGFEGVLEIMEVIQQHYQENPILADQFRTDDSFNWALQDEESYPYFFGAASMVWEATAPRRKVSRFT